MEARGKQYGVNEWPSQQRHWTHAAYVPGLRYGVIPAEPMRWPGRFIMQPPQMRGSDVRRWQERMRARGWPITVDGEYGPRSEAICRQFRRRGPARRRSGRAQYLARTWPRRSRASGSRG